MENTKVNNISKVGKKAAIYENGNVFKSLLIMSLPILILMLTNTLYQLIDSAIAANMVTFNVEYNGSTINISGSMISMFTIPVMLICMAAISLTNMGFGTIYSQRLGAQDEEGAKKAISTMHLTNFIIILISLIISFSIIKPWLEWIIPSDEVWSAFKAAGIVQDATWSMIIYALTITFASFQGIISRQLRAEGHIKGASFIPLISIPFNIIFDIILMGPAGMGVTGAAIATMIASTITTVCIFAYATYLSKKGETHISLSVFKYGVDWKVFGAMIVIGIIPFVMQIGRAYNQILSLLLYTKVGGPLSLQLFSAISRPMMLIIMPSFALVQTGSAMIGYNYGAKNHKRVSSVVWAMVALVVLLALPQWIFIMAWPQAMYWLFGANHYIQQMVDNGIFTLHQINTTYHLYLSLSIISVWPAIMMTYYMATKKPIYGLLQSLNAFFITNTIVLVVFYFTVGQTSGMEIYFFSWFFFWTILSQLISWPMFLFVLHKDKKLMEREAAKEIMI